MKDKVKRRGAPIKHLFESKQAKNLRLTQAYLVTVYEKYKWKPYDGKITLIRSSEKHAEERSKFEITQWNSLAKQGLDVFVVDAMHLNIFIDPQAKGLAEQLQKCLDKSR